MYYKNGAVNIVCVGSLSKGVLEPVILRPSIEVKEKLSKWAKWGWPFLAEEEYRQCRRPGTT